MSHPNETETAPAERKKPIQVLRQRRGGVPRELIERNRTQNLIRRRLTEALRAGPKTVPELASAIDLPTHEVLWYVMGMKKYGKVVEADQTDGYFQYQLADEPETTETTS